MQTLLFWDHKFFNDTTLLLAGAFTIYLRFDVYVFVLMVLYQEKRNSFIVMDLTGVADLFTLEISDRDFRIGTT